MSDSSLSNQSISTDRSGAIEARLAKLANQWSKGKVSLKQIVGLNSEELFTLSNQGYLMFLQGKTAEAKVIFEGLVAIDPKNAYFYRALGAIYWRNKEAEKAVKQFTYAMRVAPKEIANYINRAEVYISTGKMGHAKKDLQFAIDNGKPHESALLNKAEAMLSLIKR